MLPPHKRRLLISLFGFILGIFGLLQGIFSETLINYLIQKVMVIRPDSAIFNLWRAPPIRTKIEFYLFNWTNSEDFYNTSTKPIFKEIGPYRFYEEAEKFDFQWHPSNGTVTYRKASRYYYDTEGVNGNLNDRYVTYNVLLSAAATKLRHLSSWKRTLADIALHAYNFEITLKKSVREILFDGYYDSVVAIGNKVPATVTGVDIPFDRVGFCYGRNNTSRFQGYVNMFTGEKDISKIGQLYSWNNNTINPYYLGDSVHIHGSGGEFQPPNQQVNGSVEIFLPDLCRSVILDYDKPMTHDGIYGYKYIGGPRSMDNGTRYPEMAPYCNGNCMPAGLMNLSKCLFDVPVFASYPHFYNTEPYYLDQVVGLKPNKEEHELYMLVDPRTGFAFKLAAKVQVNVLIEPVPYISLLRNAPKILFPIVWLKYNADLTSELADYLRAIPKFILAGQIFGGICFGIGLLMLWWQPIKAFLLNKPHLHQHMRVIDLSGEHQQQHHITDKKHTRTKEHAPLLRDPNKHALVARSKSLSTTSETTMSDVLSITGLPSYSTSLNST